MKQTLLYFLISSSLLVGCSQQSEQKQSEESPVITLNAGVGVVTGSGDFGTLSPTGSKTLSIKIANTGDEALVGPPQIDNSNFSIVYQNGCTSIAPGKYCQLKLNFSAKGKASGPHLANLNLDSAFLALSATIVDPNENVAESVAFSANPLDFGSITDKQSLVKNLTITNTGVKSINQVVTVGPLYSVSYDNCSNKAVAPGKSCMLKISLSGSGKAGAVNETLSYAGQVIPIISVVEPSQGSSGLGSPNIKFLVSNLETVSHSFGTLSGNLSKQVIIYAKNTGTKASENASAYLLSNSNFSIAYNQCVNRSLAPNASCQIRVVFSSTGKSEGEYIDTLTFNSLSFSLSALVGSSTVVTYNPVFSDYSSCSANLACMGEGTQTRTVSNCERVENGIPTGTMEAASNCQTNVNPSLLSQVCQSPAGDIQETVFGGTQTVSCLAGSSIKNFQSILCDSGFEQQGNACVISSNFAPGISLLTDINIIGSGTTTNECGFEYYDDYSGTMKISAIRQFMGYPSSFDEGMPITSPLSCQYSVPNDWMDYQAIYLSDGNVICRHMMTGYGFLISQETEMFQSCWMVGDYYINSRQVQEITSGPAPILSADPSQIETLGDQVFYITGNQKIHMVEIPSSQNPQPITSRETFNDLNAYDFVKSSSNIFIRGSLDGENRSNIYRYNQANNSFDKVIPSCGEFTCQAMSTFSGSDGKAYFQYKMDNSQERRVYSVTDGTTLDLIVTVPDTFSPAHEVLDDGKSLIFGDFIYYKSNSANDLIRFNKNGGGSLEVLPLKVRAFQMAGNSLYVFSYTTGPTQDRVHKIDLSGNISLVHTVTSGFTFSKAIKGNNYMYFVEQQSNTLNLYRINSANDQVSLAASNYMAGNGCGLAGYTDDFVNPLTDTYVFNCVTPTNSSRKTGLVKINNSLTFLNNTMIYNNLNSANAPQDFFQLAGRKGVLVHKNKLFFHGYNDSTGADLMSLDANDNFNFYEISGGDSLRGGIYMSKTDKYIIYSGTKGSENELYLYYEE